MDPLPAPDSKEAYVREMFRTIAWRYDLMNRIMTIGRDQAWRRYTVEQALPSGSQVQRRSDVPVRVLDVATGTGDLALEVQRSRAGVRVVGLDFVPEMLSLAQAKAAVETGTPALTAADALRIPFADASFDAVVTGFALRNVTDIPAAFAEMARVTRPNGRVGCLEIAKPRQPLFRRLFALYFYRFVPLIGGIVTGQPSAYTYLPHSLTAFLTPPEIADVMRQTGWRDVRFRRLMLGTVAVHVGVRD